MSSREDTQRMIAVMQAFVEGKIIEVQSKGSLSWTPLDWELPVWDWSHNHYRIKPREWWIAPEYGAVFLQPEKSPQKLRMRPEDPVRDYEIVHVREVLEE